MSLKSDLATVTVAALQDIRCAASRLTLEDILVRREFSQSVPQYRVYEKNSNVPVATFQDLLTYIREDNILITYDMAFVGSNFRDKCKPVTVVIKDLEVRLMPNLNEDNYFTARFGKDAKMIAITLGYTSDNDILLPLKAIDAQIVPSRNTV